MIVGLGAAGLRAAIAARRVDPSSNITVVCDEPYTTYSRCGLPFVLGGEIDGFDRLVVASPQLLSKMRLNILLNSRVVDVQHDTVSVEGKDGSTNLRFDSLVLATGAKPFIPPIKGVELKNVFSLRTIDDGVRIAEALNSARRVVVVGAGAIGLEAAEAFVKRGVDVKVVELMPKVLPKLLDLDMAKIVYDGIVSHCYPIILGSGVSEIYGSESVEGVHVNDDDIPCDAVLIATGVRPDVELAKIAGLKLGVTRGILTDEHMRCSIDNIFAAGDCAETKHIVTGKPFLPLLGTVAYREGMVAGKNAVGDAAVFRGALGSMVLRICDFEVGSVGLTVELAKKEGFKVVVGKVKWYTKAEYYPTHREIVVKLIFNAEDGKIIGGQIVGGEAVAQRINLIAASIGWGITAEEMVNVDTCYSPPVADTIEPVTRAAELALRRLKK